MGWLDREVVAVWMSRGVKSIGATAVDDRKTGGRFQLSSAKPLQPTRGGRSREANERDGVRTVCQQLSSSARRTPSADPRVAERLDGLPKDGDGRRTRV